MKTMNKPITYPEAMYLKGAAAIYDVKVSYSIVNKRPIIHIRDFEFLTFENSLQCLKHIVEREIVSESGERAVQS